jgi:diacylglycerol kinase family enzyme
MMPSAVKPTAPRRIAALAAIALGIAVVVLVVAGVANNMLRLAAVLVLLALGVNAVWYAISRTGTRRRLAVAAVVATLCAAAALILSTPGWSLSIRVALLALAFVLGRYALGRDTRTLKEREPSDAPTPAARRGALIMNLKSGGGKAERFHLEDECRKRSIEPVVLQPGDDLRGLAEGAIGRGCDVIGMAGGDGSQALVASVLARHDLPLVVVPAGTRNHLALDLGLDRDDVVGALDAFGEAVERRMDLAEVNGRVFVNNVSLGLYAAIVRSPEYRDAKADTALAELPKALGPDARPYDIRFVDPNGERHDAAHLIQVSNGPYGESVVGLGTRPRLDTGRLGIVALVIPDDAAQRRFLRALATGRPDRYEGFRVWAAPTFEVASDSPVAAGLDGESVELDPPLVFSSRPGALRVRLPGHALGLSPAARAVDRRRVLPDLGRTAMGKPMTSGEA